MTTLVIKYTTEEYEHDGYCSDYTKGSPVRLLKKNDSITIPLADFNDVYGNKEPITINNIEDIVTSRLMANAITAAHIPSITPLYESEWRLGFTNAPRKRYRDRHFKFFKDSLNMMLISKIISDSYRQVGLSTNFGHECCSGGGGGGLGYCGLLGHYTITGVDCI
jgi:hypothetical protein